MRGLQQALLPLVLAIRRACLKNASVNRAPQGDALEWEQCSAIYWGSLYTCCP